MPLFYIFVSILFRAGGKVMGVSEMTRFGFGPADFERLAGMMADCILRNQDVSGDVEALRAEHTEMKYCFRDADFDAALDHFSDTIGL